MATDFDGTLAPIAASPETPQITPANRAVLSNLAGRPDVSVAVVSGRAVDDLVPRVDIPGIVYLGNHGLEVADGAGVTVYPPAVRQRPAVQRAGAVLADSLGAIPGWWIEDKDWTLTVHYREVPAARRDRLDQILDSVIDGFDTEVRFVDGKESLEVRPAVDWDKGSAVAWLAARLPDDWRTVYVGDDTTDEDVFRRLAPDDLGVAVDRDETAADVTVPSQAAVAPLFEWIATCGPLGSPSNRPVRR